MLVTQKVSEQHISQKCYEFNSFVVTSDLLKVEVSMLLLLS